MLRQVAFFCVILAVSAHIEYTKESYTNNGDHCATDCINNSCITSQDRKTELCQPGHKPAWKYHTFGMSMSMSMKSSLRFCKSRCGRFGKFYDWCFVSDTHWDYCNPDKEFKLVTDVITFSGVACTSPCTSHSNGQHTECTNIWNKVEKCHPDQIIYVEAKTAHGSICKSICRKGRYENHASCFTFANKKENCAAPARNYLALQKEMNDFKSKMVQRSYNPIDESHYMDDFNKFLINADGVIKEQVNEPGNSIYSYNMLPAYYYDEPFLPLIVKAKITKSNLPRSNSRTSTKDISDRSLWNINRMGKDVSRIPNMDTNGHLIAYKLGGPNHIYNFAPQTLYLNKGILKPGLSGKNRNDYFLSPWYDFENDIYNDVIKGNSVELCVAVIYDDLINQPRPIGFAVTQERFNLKKKKYSPVYDAFYSNDPISGLNG